MRRFILLLALLALIPAKAWALTCQFHATGNWTTAGSWQNCGGGVPSANDDVQIGTDVTTGTLTIDCSTASPCVAKSVDMTSFTGTVSLAAGKGLNVGNGSGGMFKATSGNTFTPSNTSLIKLVASGGGPYNFYTGGHTMGPITVDSPGVTYAFQDNITFAGVTAFTQTNGGIDLTAVATITNGTFSSSNTNTRSLTMDDVVWTLTSGAGTGWDITDPTNMTLSAASSTITLAQTSTDSTYNGGGLTYGTIQNTALTTGLVTIGNFVGTTLNLSQGNSVGDLVYGYALSGNMTFSGTCTLNGFSVYFRDWIRSDTKGTTRTISCGTVTTADANFEDITGAGAGSWDVSSTSVRGGDLGGNSGITFAATKTCYIKNGGASINFTDANVWTTTDNGGVTCTTTIPLPHDTGAFRTGWTAAARTFTMNAAASWAPKLDFAGVSNSPTLAFTANYLYSNSLVLDSSVTVSGTGQITFEGSGTRTIDITTAGKTITPKILQQTGPNMTVRQLDNLTNNRNTTNCFDITSGIYRNNTYTTNCTGAAGTIAITGGTFKASGNMTSSSGVAVFSLTAGSFLADTGYHLGTLTLNQQTVAADSASGGSCTFGQLNQFPNMEAANDNRLLRKAI